MIEMNFTQTYRVGFFFFGKKEKKKEYAQHNSQYV